MTDLPTALRTTAAPDDAADRRVWLRAQLTALIEAVRRAYGDAAARDLIKDLLYDCHMAKKANQIEADCRKQSEAAWSRMMEEYLT